MNEDEFETEVNFDPEDDIIVEDHDDPEIERFRQRDSHRRSKNGKNDRRNSRNLRDW